MTFSILHISDLHRDPSQGIRNGPLLRSLVNDRDRYSNEITPPSIIVVSGDIVYGVSTTQSAPEVALAAQYQEAEEFLVELADSFLDGDRQRLILVPGNHDVSYPHTLAALTPVTSTTSGSSQSLDEAVTDLFSPHSLHRWSWKDLQLFRLADSDCYNRRIELFADLYARFYERNRAYSLKPEEQFDIFSYPSYGLVFAAFNSCYNNDPLHRAGCIHPDAIAAVAQRTESLRYEGCIPIAVWHHNTTGGPHSEDYMDSDTLQVLIDCGFSIGLHGHQHKPTFVDERFRFGTGRKITVISAGTLCGGHHSLPHGHDRSYNVIVLNPATFSATVHQRRMVNESFDSPVWSAGCFLESNESLITFDIQQPLVPQRSSNACLAEADHLIAKGDYAGARNILLDLARTDGNARRILAECYDKLPYDPELINSMFPPQSVSEAVLLADALWELGDKQRLREMLSLSIIRNNSDPAITELCQKFETRLK